MFLIIEKFEDILSISVLTDSAVKEYFMLLFFLEGDVQLDKKEILNMFRITPTFKEIFEFKTASQKFNFIENETISGS